ncbi:MAG: hypothetical protein M3356_06525 [Actinomycetota bacterium]|nr:hypothetical protein [Actinomycetota bacterium]
MRASSDAAGSLRESWRRLNTEQRVAAAGALLLVVSTFGPFSFVEAAIVLTGLGVLLLLRQRADRKLFHLPLGDGTVILAAGLWSALLIVTRIFDRPLGQSILALGCAAILAAAGLRERAKRPADDVPGTPPPPRAPPRPRRGRSPVPADPAAARLAERGPPDRLADGAETERLTDGDTTRRMPDGEPTKRLPAEEPVQLSLDEPDDPPEYRPER